MIIIIINYNRSNSSIWKCFSIKIFSSLNLSPLLRTFSNKTKKNMSSSLADTSSHNNTLQLDDSVLRMLLDVQPWPETIRNLHAKFDELEKSTSLSPDQKKKKRQQLEYLVEKVFPTLVPAMSELSEVIRRDVDSKSGHPAAPPTFPPTRCTPGIGEGEFEATGVVHPVVWLAQRLLRGGSERGVVSDEQHPFCELLKRAPPSH